MLRITFTTLAIVASAVTLTVNSTEISEWWKYIPMAGLILISLILWITIPSSNRNRKPKTSDIELNKEESLEDFGIVDIRPVDPDKTYADPPDLGEGMDDAPTPKGIQLSLLSETGQQPDSKDIFTPYVLTNPLEKQIIVPILQGFRVVLDAHAMGIIQPMSNDHEYEVCGTAGFDWIRSRGESFVLKYDLLQKSETSAIHNVGPQDLQSNHLTYSRKPASITSIGIARIGETNKLLLVDTVAQNGLYHPRAKQLLENFGDTLALLLYREDPNRPRREIIYEEMVTANTEEKELVFALIVPQKSDILTKMYRDLLDDIEKNFSDCLLRVDPDCRVIKFGELLYGIFKNCTKNELEPWHQAVQSEIANQGGLLTGGVYIGAVAMTKDHQTADHLRDDAKRALLQAYEGPDETVVI